MYNTLQAAIERQLVADVKVGAFLSGGLDSSAIAAFAARKLGAENLPCYTISVDQSAMDGMHTDLPYARKVARHLGVSLEVVKVDAAHVINLPQLIFDLDEPQADMAPLNAKYIASLARQQGVKVLLSGAGGDDLLAGYRRHFALSKERYWARFPKICRQQLQRWSGILPKSHPLLRRFSKAFEHASLNELERLTKYFHWLNAEVVADLFLAPLPTCCDPVVAYLSKLPTSMTPLQKMLQLETKFFLADHNLNYTDKVSMAEGVEIRVPLIDLEMVRLAAKIPDAHKLRGRHGKWIFKKTMEKLLPREVVYRPKTGFGAPVRSWLRNELKKTVNEVLSERSIRSRGLFNYAKVKELVERDRAGKIDAAYTILALMAIEYWCRQFIDVPVPTCTT